MKLVKEFMMRANNWVFKPIKENVFLPTKEFLDQAREMFIELTHTPQPIRIEVKHDRFSKQRPQ